MRFTVDGDERCIGFLAPNWCVTGPHVFDRSKTDVLEAELVNVTSMIFGEPVP